MTILSKPANYSRAVRSSYRLLSTRIDQSTQQIHYRRSQTPKCALNSSLAWHTRGFHDYFVQLLPPSSQHPEKAHERQTARIPLKSAKHHFGVFTSRGERAYNEDTWQAGVVELAPFGEGDRRTSAAGKGTSADGGTSSSDSSVFYFGIFDGHGGDVCSKFLKNHLHTYLEETAATLGFKSDPPNPISKNERLSLQSELTETWKTTVGGYYRRFKPDFDTSADYKGDVLVNKPRNIQQEEPPSMENLLVYSFMKADLDFVTAEGRASSPDTKDKQLEPEKEHRIIEMQTPLGDHNTPPLQTRKGVTSFKGGSTCSIALVSMPIQTEKSLPFWHPSALPTIVTAHAGDTRILLCHTRSGEPHPLTTNHHPALNSEAKRLRRFAANFVTDSFGEERFGVLANTRSFGDVPQKRLGVTAEPELRRVTLDEKEQFSFLVLVTDGISGTLTDQEIVDVVKDSRTPDEAAKKLVDFAVQVTKEGDNATAMVVRLGGWESRGTGEGTKELRQWKKDEAEQMRSRRM